jgi:hypothetical protein
VTGWLVHPPWQQCSSSRFCVEKIENETQPWLILPLNTRVDRLYPKSCFACWFGVIKRTTSTFVFLTMKSDTIDKIVSWIENEERCVTTQRICHTMNVSRKRAAELLSEIHTTSGEKYQMTKCHTSKTEENGVPITGE